MNKTLIQISILHIGLFTGRITTTDNIILTAIEVVVIILQTFYRWSEGLFC